MAKGKAKDLDGLLRYNRWIVDERQRELGLAIAREEELLELQRTLDQQMIQERETARKDPTGAGFSFGRFAQDHRQRREMLQSQIHEAEKEVEEAQKRLAEAYRQLKVYEEVQKSRAEEEAREEARKEQEMLDEIAANLHRRKQRGE